MSYIDNTLLVQEHVLYRAQPHWIVFGFAGAWLFIALVLVSVLSGGFVLMAVVPLSMTIYEGALALIRYKTSEFAVTNKRVLVKVGFIKRSSLEIFLQKVEGIQVHQGIIGRLFNFGTIIIAGTGGSRDAFDKISDPLEFRRRVQEQIEQTLVPNNITFNAVEA